MILYLRNTSGLALQTVRTTLERFSRIIFAFYVIFIHFLRFECQINGLILLPVKMSLGTFIVVTISSALPRRAGNDSVVLTVQSEECLTCKGRRYFRYALWFHLTFECGLMYVESDGISSRSFPSC